MRGASVARSGGIMKRICLVTVMLAGCGGGSEPEPDLGALFPDECPTVTCPGGATIASSQDFVAVVDSSQPWTARGDYTSGCLPASPDHQVTGTVTVRGGDLKMPPNAGPATFRSEPRFVL